MAEMFVTLGTWNWLIFGLILMALELMAPGVFLFWLGLAALLVGLLSFVINPSWQIAAPDVRGVRRRRRAAVAPRRAQQRRASATAIRSSTSAPMRWSAACSRWRSRSSTAPARCGSTTRSGASPVPTRRPAAGSSRAGRRRQPDGGGGLNQSLLAFAPALGEADAAAGMCASNSRPTCRQAIAVSPAPVRRSRLAADRPAAPAARSARRRRRPRAARARSARCRAVPTISATSSAGPSRSSSTMIGRPVREPRTARLVFTAACFAIGIPLARCYR